MVLTSSVAWLAVAMVVAIVTRRLSQPYTVGLVLVGVIIALTPINLGGGLTHDFIFYVILPPLLFEAALVLNGRELWKSDGTPAGTQLVKAVMPGQNFLLYPQALAAVGSDVYFQADDGANGTELWKSDGTAFGTYLVKDIDPGPDSSYPFWTVAYAGEAYFAATDGAAAPG